MIYFLHRHTNTHAYKYVYICTTQHIQTKRKTYRRDINSVGAALVGFWLSRLIPLGYLRTKISVSMVYPFSDISSTIQ